MTIMEEINKVFPLLVKKPKFVCKVHEDNQSCIKMATGIKFTPRTKHIALKYHHFRLNVKSGRVEIVYTPTQEQLADILTKPLSSEAFFTLRYMLCGWRCLTLSVEPSPEKKYEVDRHHFGDHNNKCLLIF